MCNEIVNASHFLISTSLKNHNASLSGTCSQNKPIFPGSPRDTVYRGVQIFIENLGPILVLLPKDLQATIVAACSNDAFKLWMGPSDLPDWAFVHLEGHWLLLLAIFQSCNLQEAVAVTGCQTCAKEVKLAVVDVVFVVSLH